MDADEEEMMQLLGFTSFGASSKSSKKPPTKPQTNLPQLVPSKAPSPAPVSIPPKQTQINPKPVSNILNNTDIGNYSSSSDSDQDITPSLKRPKINPTQNGRILDDHDTVLLSNNNINNNTIVNNTNNMKSTVNSLPAKRKDDDDDDDDDWIPTRPPVPSDSKPQPPQSQQPISVISSAQQSKTTSLSSSPTTNDKSDDDDDDDWCPPPPPQTSSILPQKSSVPLQSSTTTSTNSTTPPIAATTTAKTMAAAWDDDDAYSNSDDDNDDGIESRGNNKISHTSIKHNSTLSSLSSLSPMDQLNHHTPLFFPYGVFFPTQQQQVTSILCDKHIHNIDKHNIFYIKDNEKRIKYGENAQIDNIIDVPLYIEYNNYKNTNISILFYNSIIYCGGSDSSLVSYNLVNSDGIIHDNAKYINEQQIITSIIPFIYNTHTHNNIDNKVKKVTLACLSNSSKIHFIDNKGTSLTHTKQGYPYITQYKNNDGHIAAITSFSYIQQPNIIDILNYYQTCNKIIINNTSLSSSISSSIVSSYPLSSLFVTLQQTHDIQLFRRTFMTAGYDGHIRIWDIDNDLTKPLFGSSKTTQKMSTLPAEYPHVERGTHEILSFNKSYLQNNNNSSNDNSIHNNKIIVSSLGSLSHGVLAGLIGGSICYIDTNSHNKSHIWSIHPIDYIPSKHYQELKKQDLLSTLQVTKIIHIGLDKVIIGIGGPIALCFTLLCYSPQINIPSIDRIGDYHIILPGYTLDNIYPIYDNVNYTSDIRGIITSLVLCINISKHIQNIILSMRKDILIKYYHGHKNIYNHKIKLYNDELIKNNHIKTQIKNEVNYDNDNNTDITSNSNTASTDTPSTTTSTSIIPPPSYVPPQNTTQTKNEHDTIKDENNSSIKAEYSDNDDDNDSSNRSKGPSGHFFSDQANTHIGKDGIITILNDGDNNRSLISNYDDNDENDLLNRITSWETIQIPDKPTKLLFQNVISSQFIDKQCLGLPIHGPDGITSIIPENPVMHAIKHIINTEVLQLYNDNNINNNDDHQPPSSFIEYMNNNMSFGKQSQLYSPEIYDNNDNISNNDKMTHITVDTSYIVTLSLRITENDMKQNSTVSSTSTQSSTSSKKSPPQYPYNIDLVTSSYTMLPYPILSISSCNKQLIIGTNGGIIFIPQVPSLINKITLDIFILNYYTYIIKQYNIINAKTSSFSTIDNMMKNKRGDKSNNKDIFPQIYNKDNKNKQSHGGVLGGIHNSMDHYHMQGLVDKKPQLKRKQGRNANGDIIKDE